MKSESELNLTLTCFSRSYYDHLKGRGGKSVCRWYQGSRLDLLWPLGLTVALVTSGEAVWARWKADFTLICYLAFAQLTVLY